jgi:long-chain acyl-CoA synthetase
MSTSAVRYNQSVIDNRPPTVGRQFLDRVRDTPQREAFRYPVGEEWESVTWREAGDRVARLAAGLVALGIEPEQRVGIASSTRYEWVLADLAVMCAGAATTSLYPSTIADDIGYILEDSESRVVFAEDDVQLAKLRGQRDRIPQVRTVVTFDGAADGDWVISLSDLEKLGEELLGEQPDVVEQRVTGSSADSLATLIYTSGTTGRPKGVRLVQSTWTYQGAAILARGTLREDDLQYLWLPLAHAFGKVLLSSQLSCGFATAIDGRVEKIIDNLAVVRPTFMAAAPRVFEKAYGRIVTMVKAEGGVKEKLFEQAFRVAKEADRLRFEGRPVPVWLRAQRAVFDRLVFAKIRARFGGRLRFFVSGAAALDRDVAAWFHAAGILILEGYGLTETAAGAFVNDPDDYQLGSVGTPLPGTEAKIADDGEVLIKGPCVMAGYHNLADETAQALSDGWLHTGDIGEIDARGFLRITDRKKDLFKTSGGKYVAPSAIESRFKALCPYASQFLVHGSERNFCVAMITLDPDAMAQWADQQQMAGAPYAELVTSPQVREMVGEYVDRLNATLNRWETIKKWILLDHDLSVESGELTPSMKVRRRVVEANNKDQLDALYR